MLRLLPFIAAALVIVALTLVEGAKTDRWFDHSQEQGYCASLLDEIPTAIGDWEGEDRPVDEDIQKTAGAVGYISRVYTNKKTDQHVIVWCVLGHAMETAIHEPTICYPAQGFKCTQNMNLITHPGFDDQSVTFRTSLFEKSTATERFTERIFWTWFQPTVGGESGNVVWNAPEENPRMAFGNARSLYKIYFSNRPRSESESSENSVCLEFANEFFATANPILKRANGPIPERFVYVKKKEEEKTFVPDEEEAH